MSKVTPAISIPKRGQGNLLNVRWIKRLVFFHHGPRDMQQFPCGGTAGHFLWFMLASLRFFFVLGLGFVLVAAWFIGTLNHWEQVREMNEGPEVVG